MRSTPHPPIALEREIVFNEAEGIVVKAQILASILSGKTDHPQTGFPYSKNQHQYGAA